MVTQTSHLLKRYAPRATVIVQSTVITARSTGNEKEDKPIKHPLNPSTEYDSGFTRIISFIQLGTLSIGKNAVDRKISGIIIRFIISWNPWKSSNFEAMASPNPAEKKAVRIMNTIEGRIPKRIILTPKRKLIPKIISP